MLAYKYVKPAPKASVNNLTEVLNTSMGCVEAIVFKKELFPFKEFHARDPKMQHDKGGPAGELVLFWSLIHSMRQMDDVSVTVPKSLAQLREAVMSKNNDNTFLFLDEYGLDDLKRILTPLGTYESWKCRLRFLDFWVRVRFLCLSYNFCDREHLPNKITNISGHSPSLYPIRTMPGPGTTTS